MQNVGQTYASSLSLAVVSVSSFFICVKSFCSFSYAILVLWFSLDEQVQSYKTQFHSQKHITRKQNILDQLMNLLLLHVVLIAQVFHLFFQLFNMGLKLFLKCLANDVISHASLDICLVGRGFWKIFGILNNFTLRNSLATNKPAAFIFAISSFDASKSSSNLRFLASKSLMYSCCDLILASICTITKRHSSSSFTFCSYFLSISSFCWSNDKHFFKIEI